jgi:hypothetical protein
MFLVYSSFLPWAPPPKVTGIEGINLLFILNKSIHRSRAGVSESSPYTTPAVPFDSPEDISCAFRRSVSFFFSFVGAKRTNSSKTAEIFCAKYSYKAKQHPIIRLLRLPFSPASRYFGLSLLDSNRLGQVPREVDVEALHDGEPVGNEL